MVASMAVASDKKLAKAAKRWAKLVREQDGEDLGDLAHRMLSDVANLARIAARNGHHLYCWHS
jgi:hypothetical protein